MKILKVTIENFLAITQGEITLADRGLVLVQGENLIDSSAQSNGAGKSSIADALCWALYGVTARGATGNEVINTQVGKDCRVAVIIQDGDITYSIRRHRKHHEYKNALTVSLRDGLDVTDLTKGTDKLTQEAVNAIIGTSLEVFRGSIYAGQEMMPDLPAMTDKQLKMLIEEAAGIEVLEKASEVARSRLKEANFTLQSINNELDKLQERIEYTNNHIVNLDAEKNKWQENQTKLIEELQNKAKESIVQLRQVKAKLESFNKTKIEESIAKTQAEFSSINEMQAKLRQLDQLVNKQAVQVATCEKTIEAQVTLIESLEKKIAALRNEIGTPCSQCGQIMNENHIHSKSGNLAAELEMVATQLGVLTQSLTEVEDELENSKKARDDFAQNAINPSRIAAQLNDYQAQLAKVLSVENEQKLLIQAGQNIAKQINDAKAAQCPYDAQIEKARKELTDTQYTLGTMQTRQDAQELVCQHEEAVVRIFDPAGVRARILDDVTPFLNAQTEKYLSALSDGHISATWTTLSKAANGALKEKFSIEVEKDNGAQSFRGLSGGEKRKVRIAGALALQDLVATRATKPIELFIGDEIDDALDPAGLERLTMILEEKARERGSVFIISHNELRDHVNQVLTVQKCADGTTNIIET